LIFFTKTDLAVLKAYKNRFNCFKSSCQ